MKYLFIIFNFIVFKTYLKKCLDLLRIKKILYLKKNNFTFFYILSLLKVCIEISHEIRE